MKGRSPAQTWLSYNTDLDTTKERDTAAAAGIAMVRSGQQTVDAQAKLEIVMFPPPRWSRRFWQRCLRQWHDHGRIRDDGSTEQF